MKRLLFLAMAIAAFTMSSCSEIKDGDWDPMEWNVDASTKKTTKNPRLEVPAKGGDYNITCKNYASFWILNITVNNETIWTAADWSIENDWTTAETEYVNVNATGKALKLSIEPNKTNSTRTIVIDIEAGDAFSTLTVIQAAE